MERKLIDYLPNVVRDYAEFQGITSGQQPEFEKIWGDIDNLLEDQFVFTSGNEGLSRREKILGITTRTGDNLSERRTRILSRINENTPYTITWLKSWMQNFEIKDTPVLNEYQLDLKLPIGSNYTQILKDLDSRIPVNILVHPTIILTELLNHFYVGLAVRIGKSKSISMDPVETSNYIVVCNESNEALLDQDGNIFVL